MQGMPWQTSNAHGCLLPIGLSFIISLTPLDITGNMVGYTKIRARNHFISFVSNGWDPLSLRAIHNYIPVAMLHFLTVRKMKCFNVGMLSDN